MKTLSAYLQKALEGITNARGMHVHSSRLTDENLERLNLLELINHGPDKIPGMKTLYDSAYSDTKKKYSLNIKQTNKEIKKILDTCFNVLYGIVANENRRIRYPKSQTA
jgi:hypothetical protein